MSDLEDAIQKYFDYHGPTCDEDGHVGEPDAECEECLIDTRCSSAVTKLLNAAKSHDDALQELRALQDPGMPEGLVEAVKYMIDHSNDGWQRAAEYHRQLVAPPPAEKTFVFARADDWIGLYIDGKLVAEGHSLRAHDALDALGFESSDRDVNIDWIERIGSLPANIDDVKWAGDE